MRLSLHARRAAIRCAYIGLRVYWFLARPQLSGVKCIITHAEDVLLVRHTYGSRSWDLPGGQIRRREVPLETARREMNEELGRRIERDLVEIAEAEWFPRDALPDDLGRYVRPILARLTGP